MDTRTKTANVPVTDKYKLSQLELSLSLKDSLWRLGMAQCDLKDIPQCDFKDPSVLVEAIQFATTKNEVALLLAIIRPAVTIIDAFISAHNILANELLRILRIYRKDQGASEYSIYFILNHVTEVVSRDDETIVS